MQMASVDKVMPETEAALESDCRFKGVNVK